MYKIANKDCYEFLEDIEDDSIDMVLVDPPYGTVKDLKIDGWRNRDISWDNELDFVKIFNILNRKVKMNGNILVFSQEPFTSKLIGKKYENIEFSYRMIWEKDHFANALKAKKSPLNYYEDINVFFKKYDIFFHNCVRAYSEKIFKTIGKTLKQINSILGHRKAEHFLYYNTTQFSLCSEKVYEELVSKFNLKIILKKDFLEYEELKKMYKKYDRVFNIPEGKKFVSNIFKFKKDYSKYHPTQKPVKLLEELIKIYSNEGDTILDFTMGSGTTGVACKNLNRKFIGCEIDLEYYNIAKERLEIS